MRTIYRASFELRSKDGKGDLYSQVSDAVWRWIFDRKELGLKQRPGTAYGTSTIPVFKAGYFEIETLGLDCFGQRIWGLTLRQNETRNPNMIWVSELLLSRKEGQPCYFSLNQMVGRSDGTLLPLKRNPGRPRIISTLLNDFDAYSGAQRLVGKPFQVRSTDEDLNEFIRILQSPNRRHPVVFVSLHDQSKSHLIKSAELADHLCGLAQVFLAETSWLADKFSASFPRCLGCRDGAIRIYWPGFQRDSPACHHRLWTADDLAEEVEFDSGRFADRVLAQISEVSTFNTSPDYCSWQQAQALDRRRIIEAARERQDWQPLAEELDLDNQAKVAELALLNEELRAANEALYNEREISAGYRKSIEKNKESRTALTKGELPVESVSDALDRAAADFPDKLAISLNSRSDPNSPYQPSSDVYLALKWLATTYRNSKTGAMSCLDLDQHLSNKISGWHYMGHQKETTMKASEDWYRCSWKGEKFWIPEHLKAGSAREAENCIRIAFAWHAKSKKVMVGFVGQHQENTKS